MQTTKDIERQAEAGAETLARQAQMLAQIDRLQKFRRLVEGFLEDYQEDAENFEEVAGVTKLIDKAAALDLDGQTSESLHCLNDYVEQIRQGYNGVIKLLEELKGV